MREIKFRGKTRLSIKELHDREIEHTDGWIIGNLIVNGDKPMIVGDLIEVDPEYIVHEQWCSVIPETVGQYTGLKDVNGVEIYEEDVAEWTQTLVATGRQRLVGTVKFFEGAFWIDNGEEAIRLFDESNPVEVIGNIHDNPELLGDTK